MTISLNIMPPPHIPPPTDSFLSKRSTRFPFWAKKYEQTRPEGPPPTTATSSERFFLSFSKYRSIMARVIIVSSSVIFFSPNSMKIVFLFSSCPFYVKGGCRGDRFYKKRGFPAPREI